ncbi:RHS repeat-associated core domain-containing protein [Saccharopolyspora antimicrobica]|uniref:RHS repeat-associated core domain-containing protein n=1 Tax=Saccharopolyspora antimicrobica TaxID=455193 RepID=A0A1I4XI44_9PSEU|nr:RHS repeat-associated core domain-containing protein [Saccharopolyspora antimicrobica]RKT84500.1 RHS repeat-associated protein [Saccharopolyspora antimicrobica]SFN24929.1 RHS repeat-associated core domain-containing protein [Saccharopolyspora antimicrobica]
MSNPLVAERKDSTESFSGVPILESIDETKKAIESGDWASGVMGAVGTGLDALTMALDPFGSILAAGVGWLMEHVGPLSDALDALTGDADQIKAHSETWKNVAAELGEINTEMTNMVNSDVADWAGEAADSYRKRSEDTGKLIEAAKKAAEGASEGIGTAGEVVAAVRTLVRDIIAELVGHLVSWALQVLATLGIAMAWVVPQVVAAVAKTVAKIADLTTKLVKAMKSLGKLMKKLGDGFGDAKKALDKIKKDEGGSGNKPDSPAPTRSTGNEGSGSRGGSGDNSTSNGNNGPASTHSQSANGSSSDRSGGNSDSQSTNRSLGDSGSPGPNSPSSTGVPPARTNPAGTGSNSRGTGGDLRRASSDSQTPGRDVDKRRCATDPVDIATGEMVLAQVDVEIAAALPLILRRTHLSSYRVGLVFGASWSSTLDQRLEIGSAGVSFAADDGKLLFAPTPAPGETVSFEGSPNTLTRHDNGGCTVMLVGEGHALHFAPGDEILRLTGITDRHRNLVHFEYDEAGTPVEIRHSAGFRIRVETEDGLVTALHLRGAADGEDLPLMRYAYTGRRLTSVINASGQALKFDYDAAGRITGWTDRNGIWYRYTFDGAGRCVRTEGVGGFLNGTFEYAGDVTHYTDSLGHTRTFHLNDAKQTIREVDPLGNETVFEWDAHDRLLSRTDPLGRTVKYDYDEAGEVTAITRPDGSRQLIEYDDRRLPVTVVDPDGAVSRREYDENGNLTAVTDPAGAVTVYAYDERGVLVSITDALGNVRRIETDATGLPVSVTNPLGAATTYRRDAFGRVAEVVDPVGGTTRFGWTVDGRLAWQTRPDGSTERWIRDGEGNVRTQVDRLGRATTTETTAFDLPSVETGPDGVKREFRYDTELRLIAVTNERGEVWRYEYDPAGNLVRETDFGGRAVSYQYDAAGQLVERTNGAGETVRFAYDLLGNLVERRSATATATFTYDLMGRLVGAANDTTRLTFERDRLGRVLAETVNGRTVASVYDLLGRRVRRRTPSGAESTWEYDAADRPVALHTAGRTLGFAYDAAGREVRRTLGTGALLTQAWNANHGLASQTLVGAGRTIQQRSYAYRPDGALVGVRDQLSGERTFELDLAGRVTAVNGPQWTERYAYDPAGNLAYADWPRSGAPDDAAVGARDYAGALITRAGNTQYAHDAEGRITARRIQQATWSYSWNAENQLTGVVTPDGQRWRYIYDPLGRRVAKQRLQPDGSAAEHVDFTWDDSLLVEQVHNGTSATVWEWEPDSYRVLAQTERLATPNMPQQWVDQRFHAIVTDLVGTPAELVDPDGNLAWHVDTALWGTLRTAPGHAYTPLRFPGQYHDHETGLHYNLNRYYDPTTGRYTSHDPLGLAPSPNPHAYAPNPTGWIDPLGLMNCSAGSSSGGTGGNGGLNNPQLRPNPQRPQWMFRGDTRPVNGPDGLFQNGLTSWGKNYDLPHHVHGGSGTNDSGYVSLTSDPNVAHQFGLYPDGGPVIQQDGKHYLSMSGQVLKIQSTDNLIHTGSQNLPPDLAQRMAKQKEWDAVHHVAPENVHSSVTVHGYFHQRNDEKFALPGSLTVTEDVNPNFVNNHPGYNPHADPNSGFTPNTDLNLRGRR